jgi:aryl carrier-like protein
VSNAVGPQGQPGPVSGSDEDELWRVLADLWEAVLKRRPEAASSFIDLGGDSLRAARLTANVKRQVTRSVRFHTIFENQTFADYVAVVRRLREEKS